MQINGEGVKFLFCDLGESGNTQAKAQPFASRRTQVRAQELFVTRIEGRMPVVKLAGETDWDAIVNNGALDIVEEERFIEYVVSMGYDPKIIELAMLETLFDRWNISERNEPNFDVIKNERLA